MLERTVTIHSLDPQIISLFQLVILKSQHNIYIHLHVGDLLHIKKALCKGEVTSIKPSVGAENWLCGAVKITSYIALIVEKLN